MTTRHSKREKYGFYTLLFLLFSLTLTPLLAITAPADRSPADFTPPPTHSPVRHSTNISQSRHPSATPRCPAKKTWSDRNIARWLHLSLKELETVKTLRALDNHDLCTMPLSKLERAIEKALHPARPDQPDKAMEFRMQQLSVYGYVKPDGLIRAAEARKRIVEKTRQFLLKRFPTSKSASSTSSTDSSSEPESDSGGTVRPISVTPRDWEFLGPGNIGGRIRTLYIHPSDTDLLFAGSVGGGIWKSTDGGASWSPVNDFMANLVVTSIAADPQTTDNVDDTVLYAATGEGFYNGDALRGYGLFKSTDGGATWEHLSSTDPTQDGDWYYVNRVAVNDQGVIIAVARNNAVFTSTDGGDSWTKNEPGPHWYSMMEDVVFDPNDGHKAIVGSINGNIYYTTDSGSTWTEVNIVDASDSWISGRVEIAYAASTPNLVYASVDHNSGEIYRSIDGGITWEVLSNPKHLGSQGWYDNAIWVDPTDADHLVIGGLDLYRSTDGGENWTKISTWWLSPDSPHADHHVIVNDPGYNGTTNKRVYNASDGGIYKADDITVANDDADNNGWTNLNHNLGVTQFYGAAGIPGSKITGGAQDNYTLLHTDANSTDWDKIAGGDGGFSAVSHESDPDKFYYFGEYVYLKIHRSDDGAGSEYIYENGLDDATNNNANFIAPFLLDPNDENTMLAGGASLWRSTNVTADDQADVTWSKIKDEVSGTKISQIAIAEGDSNLVLVGYNDGSIYKSTDANSSTPTWSKIHDANGKNVLALMIDKDNHDIFYAGWGGFASGNLQQSTDGGSSWNDISDGLPEAPMRSIVRNPYRPDYLYVGTEVGIFTSEDQGATWYADNNGPANVSVDQLFWYDDSTLVAATHGRGIFKTKINWRPCERVYRPLTAYRWTLVSFPCDTGDNSISDLLGDALGTYGDDADWVMYEQTGNDDYRAPNTEKRLMESNDTLEPGKGYWIITDANRTLKVDDTLSGLSFVTETNASDLNIDDSNFTTVFLKQLPDSNEDYAKNIILGNPFPNTIHLENVYFSHGDADDGYHPMSDSNDSDENPNAPYIVGHVYTTDDSGEEIYKAIAPDTPGFSDTIDPMVAFFIQLNSGETGSNYLALPDESESR